jgi:Flp pilus assembly protein TadG
MTLIRRRQERRHGAASVEFAVIAVFLVPLLIGVWEVGRLVEVQQYLSNAVREGGRQASTGNRDATAVKQVVVRYLTTNGIPASVNDVTVTNLTSSSRNDPTQAEQLDQYRVTISIPFNSIRWILLNQITSKTTLTASADWYSMRDIPLAIDSKIPLQ